MPARRTLHFDIADRQQELRGVAAPDDFVLARRDTPLPFPADALAYCADMGAERVLFSLHGGRAKDLLQAPFLFVAQLRDAEGVVTVPFEQVAEVDGATPCRPTLIFSPGRAGSTLFARLLQAAGAACASEPDMLTQICRFGREERMRIGPDMEVALLRACLAALCRVAGPAPFVKLRSHCNARPLPLLAAGGGGAILLMRRMRDWALSRHLAFGEPPASVAAILRETLDAADKLLGEPMPPRIVWFEDLRADPGAVLRSCAPNFDADSIRISRVMQADSQAGMAFDRAAVARATAESGFAAAFAEAWSRAQAGADWSPATHALLADIGPV
jgi:hypothetical protein